MTFREAIARSSYLMDQYYLALITNNMDQVDIIYPKLQFSLDHIIDYDDTIKTPKDDLEFMILFSKLVEKYEKISKLIKKIVNEQ